MIKTSIEILEDLQEADLSLASNLKQLEDKVWVERDSELEFLKSFFFDYEGRVVNNLTKNEILFKIERRIEELMNK